MPTFQVRDALCRVWSVWSMLKRFKSVCKRIMLIIAIRGRSASTLMSCMFGFHCVVVWKRETHHSRKRFREDSNGCIYEILRCSTLESIQHYYRSIVTQVTLLRKVLEAPKKWSSQRNSLFEPLGFFARAARLSVAGPGSSIQNLTQDALNLRLLKGKQQTLSNSESR